MDTPNRRETTPARRITPADEAYLRRHRAGMKFAYAGPFVALLDPIRPTRPERGPSGIILRKQPRYTPWAAESWAIGGRVDAGLLEQVFGREYGSVLDDPTGLDSGIPSDGQRLRGDKPKRRRARRGGRKVAS